MKPVCVVSIALMFWDVVFVCVENDVCEDGVVVDLPLLRVAVEGSEDGVHHHHRFIVRFPIGLDFPLITIPFQGWY